MYAAQHTTHRSLQGKGNRTHTIRAPTQQGGRSGASVQSTSECIGSVGFSHVVRSLGHGGRVIAVAVSRQLDDIPAMTAVDATRELGVTRGRITQLFRRDRLSDDVPDVRTDEVSARHDDHIHERCAHLLRGHLACRNKDAVLCGLQHQCHNSAK